MIQLPSPVGLVFTRGAQAFRVIGEEPYTRKDGGQTALYTIEAACIDCGERFEFISPASRLEAPLRRCAVHRAAGKRIDPRELVSFLPGDPLISAAPPIGTAVENAGMIYTLTGYVRARRWGKTFADLMWSGACRECGELFTFQSRQPGFGKYPTRNCLEHRRKPAAKKTKVRKRSRLSDEQKAARRRQLDAARKRRTRAAAKALTH